MLCVCLTRDSDTFWTRAVRPSFEFSCSEPTDCTFDCYLENTTTSETFPLECTSSGIVNMTDTVHNTVRKIHRFETLFDDCQFLEEPLVCTGNFVSPCLLCNFRLTPYLFEP